MVKNINRENAEFWNELCGSSLAHQIGITEHSKESLQRFDEAYLSLYPYLLQHVRLGELVGKRVLEIGLGYGTLGQKILEKAGLYHGLDIALEPVRMMNHRLRMSGQNGISVVGSADGMPFKDENFDQVVSIGCFHHTGNTEKCIQETHRVLRPGGKAVIMLYNRFSLRKWTRWPIRTALALASETFSFKNKGESTEAERKAYDAGLDGDAAPETEFFSKNQIYRMFGMFANVDIKSENCDHLGYPRMRIFISREKLLPYIGKFAGLDYYVVASK